jgi:hypothetical protein
MQKACLNQIRTHKWEMKGSSRDKEYNTHVKAWQISELILENNYTNWSR